MRDTRPYTSPQEGTDQAASVKNSQNEVLPTSGCVYLGQVVKVDLFDRTLTVQYGGTLIPGCLYAAGMLANLVGAAETGLPCVGTRVLFVPGDPAYVIGAVGNATSDMTANRTTATGVAEEPVPSMDAYCTKNRQAEEVEVPTGMFSGMDMYPGESQWTNNMGMFIRLLGSLAQLNAGDLAKVEVCLLNAMVRIVSNYFVHHSCGGDEMIYNNGRCNQEEHFTGYPHEADGQESESSPIIEGSGSAVELEDIQDPVNETGRWRWSRYLGFIGDLVHQVVTDPTEVVSTYMEGALRAGKSRLWQGSDGTVLVQSAKEIALEVVPRVIVPVQLKKWDDPSFDFKDAMSNLNGEYLKLWGTGPDFKDLELACWQLRTYARWLSEVHAMARYHQLAEGDLRMFEVPSEQDSPKADWTCKEKDKEKANPTGGEYGKEVYATIRILPNGDIAIMNGDGASVIMNGKHMQLSAPGNIDVQAGGNIAMTCKNFFVKAANNVEISAIGGAMLLKARAFMHMLCELGRIWIKTDAEVDVAANKSRAEGNKVWDMPSGEYVEPEMNDFAIVLDASRGRALVGGYAGVVVDTQDNEAPVKIQTRGAAADICLVTSGDVRSYSTNTYIKGASSVGIASAAVGVSSNQVKLGSNFLVQGSIVNVSMLRSSMISAVSAIQGPKNEQDGHRNHIASIPEDKSTVTPTFESEYADKAMQEADNMNQAQLRHDTTTEYTNNTWSYFSPEVYGVAGMEPEDASSLKGSPFLDNVLNDEQYAKAFSEWNFTAKDRPMTGRGINTGRLPYPGTQVKTFVFGKQTEPIGAVWSTKATPDLISTAADMTGRPAFTYIHNPANETNV